MCKKELFEKIIEIVSEITEVSREEILSRSRRADVTDARYLVLYILYTHGVRIYKIAELSGIPCRSVYYAINSFSMRSDIEGTILNLWIKDVKSRLQKDCNNSVN